MCFWLSSRKLDTRKKKEKKNGRGNKLQNELVYFFFWKGQNFIAGVWECWAKSKKILLSLSTFFFGFWNSIYFGYNLKF